MTISSPVTFGGSAWVRARAASSKGTVSSVPAWFRADSETNLIKQGEIVTGRPCDSVAQWSECSHGLREVLDSSPGRAVCFFLPCDNIVIYAKLVLFPLGTFIPSMYQKTVSCIEKRNVIFGSLLFLLSVFILWFIYYVSDIFCKF